MRYITRIPAGLHLPTRAISAIGNGYQGPRKAPLSPPTRTSPARDNHDAQRNQPVN